MKHYEKLAGEYVKLTMKKEDSLADKFVTNYIFCAGYETAMEELKTKAFQYHLDGYPFLEDESGEYNYKNRTMEFVTLERIYESLNREAE